MVTVSLINVNPGDNSILLHIAVHKFFGVFLMLILYPVIRATYKKPRKNIVILRHIHRVEVRTMYNGVLICY